MFDRKAWMQNYRKINKDKIKRGKKEWHVKNYKNYYNKHKKKMLISSENSANKRQTVNREKLKDYLSSHPCIDCLEPDPIVLDCHHLNPQDKKSSISDLLRRCKWEKILEEISKCEVLCANCHRRRHYSDRFKRKI